MDDQFLFWFGWFFTILTGILGAIAALLQFQDTGWERTLRAAVPVLLVFAALAGTSLLLSPSHDDLSLAASAGEADEPESSAATKTTAATLPTTEQGTNVREASGEGFAKLDTYRKSLPVLPIVSNPLPPARHLDPPRDLTVESFPRTVRGFSIRSPDGVAYELSDRLVTVGEDHSVEEASRLVHSLEQAMTGIYVRYLAYADMPANAVIPGQKERPVREPSHKIILRWPDEPDYRISEIREVVRVSPDASDGALAAILERLARQGVRISLDGSEDAP